MKNFKISKLTSITIIVIIFHILLHKIQMLVYDGNFLTDTFNTIAYSIYIPHGSRILLFLIYGYKAIPGLVVANLFAGIDNDNFENIDTLFILTSLVAALCVPTAGYCIRIVKKEVIKFSGFEPHYLVTITFLSSLINASISNLIRFFTIFDHDLNRFFAEFVGYMIGDCLGVVLIVFFYIFIKRIFYLSIQN